MQKQKKGFWLFIFSLIPGAGEMYMGFKKQGISTMLLFWTLFAFGAGTGMDWLILFFPIIWFYSFFNVHNLKSLSEEEFYSIEDSYILHFDALIGDADTLLRKYRKLIAALLIIFGTSILWNNLTDSIIWLLPQRLANFLQYFSYRLPQIIIAVVIILTGVYILSDKKHKLGEKDNKDEQEEHFWQPYRPYQQAQQPEQPSHTEPVPPETVIPAAEAEVIITPAAKETTAEAEVIVTPSAEETAAADCKDTEQL